MMGRNRRGRTSPLAWIFFGIFLVVFVLPGFARAGGGLAGLFVLLLIGWGGLQLIRIAMRAGREADHVAVRTGQVPDDVVAHPGIPEPAAPSPAAPSPAAPSPAVDAPAPQPAPDDDGYAALEARLAELGALRDRGEISVEEYERRRAEAFRTF